MTALRKFDRLEAIGHWRADPGATLREVVVSFGKTTLNITSMQDEPMAHWALGALRCFATQDETSLYAVDDDAAEYLIISDPLMIEAIATVTTAFSRPTYQRRMSAWKIVLISGFIVALGFGVTKVPNMLRDQIATQTSPIRARALSEKLAALLGRTCETPQATLSLAMLTRRLYGGTPPPGVLFIEGAGPRLLTLPDGRFVIGRALVERLTTPEALAAEIALSETNVSGSTPMLQLLHGLDLWQIFGFLLRGWPDDAALLAALQSEPRATNPQRAADMLHAARISAAPLGIADPDPVTVALDDQSWVALQGVCDR